jgi:UDP-N-acetylglucosamine--N-acetylmuramyl-(pentapeptide) pyrophosphoryl-undecaprenol N-acetylglucosamine transferase
MRTLIFTGGHHNSALVVAKELRKAGWDIIWFGHKHSMWGDKNVSAEYRDVTTAGIKFYNLQAGKFFRTYNPLKLIRIPWGFIQCFWWIYKLHKHLGTDLRGIVSFGGYLAVPTILVGKLFGLHSVAHEQTVSGGIANRVTSSFCKVVATAWPISSMPRSVYIGLPLRQEIIKMQKIKKAKSLKPILYITGGKQGSHVLNETVFTGLDVLLKHFDIIHQTGNSSITNDFQKSLTIQRTGYQSFAYDDKKAIEALGKSDLVITRGGAHTIYELGFLKKRAVVVPIPWVSHNEQQKNAEVLVQNCQAIILTEKDLTPQNLHRACLMALELKSCEQIKFPSDATIKLIDIIDQNL